MNRSEIKARIVATSLYPHPSASRCPHWGRMHLSVSWNAQDDK